MRRTIADPPLFDKNSKHSHAMSFVRIRDGSPNYSPWGAARLHSFYECLCAHDVVCVCLCMEFDAHISFTIIMTSHNFRC